MKAIAIVALSALISWSGFAQSHLDFEYRVDAIVYTDSELLTFAIYEYPHFTAHASSESQEQLEAVFSPKRELESLEPRSEEIEVVSELHNIKPNDILSPEDLFEMMKNRLGLINTKLRDTNIIVRVLIDRITYPDNRVPDFNLERIQRIWGSRSKKPYERNTFHAYSWKTGKPYKISDFAGDKAINCIKEASGVIDAPCGEQDLQSKWLEALDCNTEISRKFEDSWEFDIDPRSFGCDDSKQELIRIKVETSCFAGDEPCD